MKKEYEWKIGDKCRAFDTFSWLKYGDIGDNECFWVPAKIIGLRQSDDNESLADVEFYTGRISTGHFLRALKPSIEFIEDTE